jgi:hypothetical protein
MSALPFPWLPATFPPACDPDAPAGLSIECVGAVVIDGEPSREFVAWWPSRRQWTVTRFDDRGEPYDEVANVSHYFELPELPMLEAA